MAYVRSPNGDIFVVCARGAVSYLSLRLDNHQLLSVVNHQMPSPPSKSQSHDTELPAVVETKIVEISGGRKNIDCFILSRLFRHNPRIGFCSTVMMSTTSSHLSPVPLIQETQSILWISPTKVTFLCHRKIHHSTLYQYNSVGKMHYIRDVLLLNLEASLWIFFRDWTSPSSRLGINGVESLPRRSSCY